MNTPGSVIQIGFNKWLLFGKTLILCLFLAITGTFIFIHPLVQFETILLSLALLFICFLFLLIIIAIELVFFPKGVRIDHEDHSLKLSFYLSGDFLVHTSDLSGYRTIRIGRGIMAYEGILLDVRGGEKYIISDFSLKDYKPVKEFLEKTGVPFEGHQKFSFVLYFITYITS